MRRSPGWAWLACALPLVISAGIYGHSLDRHPLPYSDESFYPAPAISAAEGGPFAHPSRSDAPHGSRLWAYHGPLYPRLLVPVFRNFGITLAAARAPQFIAAYLAVILLCGGLLSRNYTVDRRSFSPSPGSATAPSRKFSGAAWKGFASSASPSVFGACSALAALAW